MAEANDLKNPNAGLSTTTTAPPDGRIDTNSRVTEEGTETNTVAMNGNGSAVGDAAQGAWDAVTGWFGFGGDDSETSKSEVTKSS